MTVRIIIPARYGSTRFPGKPLAQIAGVPLLQRVWAIGASVLGRAGVVVTTDDSRIADFCATIGATCVMTASDIANGTERARAALKQLPNDVDKIVNLQGDAALTPPWALQEIVQALENETMAGIVTPAVRLTRPTYEALCSAKRAGEVGGTTVVFDRQRLALYFSKTVIPFVRDGIEAPPVYRHIGLYGYRRATLEKLATLEPGPLEQAEKLEQLRALEHGIPIRVIPVDYQGRSHCGVDSPEDAARAQAIIETQGELLPVYDGSFRACGPVA